MVEVGQGSGVWEVFKVEVMLEWDVEGCIWVYKNKEGIQVRTCVCVCVYASDRNACGIAWRP